MKSLFPLLLLPACALLASDETVVTVSASRLYDPVRPLVYTDGDIGSSGEDSLPGFLERAAGLSVRHLNANPMQSSISAAGYGENGFGRVLVLLDGMRIASPDMEPPLLSAIPLDSLGSIEIVRGASSVLHGDGASAGAILLKTKHAEEKTTSARLSAGSRGKLGASVFHSGETSAFGGGAACHSAHAAFSSSDGYRQNSSCRSISGGASVFSGNDEDEGALRLSFFLHAAEYEMPGALTRAQYRENPRQAAREDIADKATASSFGAYFQKEGFGPGGGMSLHASVQRKERSAKWSGFAPSELDFSASSLSMKFLDEIECPLPETVIRILLGCEMLHDKSESTSSGSYGQDKSNYARSSFAAFILGESAISGKTVLSGGGRMQRMLSEWEESELLKSGNTEFALEMMLSRKSGGVEIFAGAKRFFRAPFSDEANYTADSLPLDPEWGYSAECGMSLGQDGIGSLSLSAFRSVTHDEIFFNPRSHFGQGYWIGYNENAQGKTERTGIELAGNTPAKKRLSLLFSLSLVRAVFSGGQFDGGDIPLVPGATAAIIPRCRISQSLYAEWMLRFVAPQHLGGDFENAQGKMPGYGMVDMTLGYESGEGKFKILLHANNLLDKKYCDYAGYGDFSGEYFYPAPGRGFALSVQKIW